MNFYVILAFLATLGTWLLTALGSATVIFFKSPKQKILNIMLGFASGVMIAASFWSLLAPAIERAESFSELPAYFVAAIGFLLGAVFIWIADKSILTIRKKIFTPQKEDSNHNSKTQRIFMLILSITLHNIPEGLAVGVAFGALQNITNVDSIGQSIMCAVSVAIGIGIQNFPEGAAVSLPLRREGFSRKKSFLLGQATGIVEPIAGVIGAILVVHIESILPYALSFAAGTMILVATHELIPECQKDRKIDSYSATMGIILGFTIMMILDIMFG